MTKIKLLAVAAALAATALVPSIAQAGNSWT